MTRKLDGLRHVRDNEWEWGCWVILRTLPDFWYAFDPAVGTDTDSPWPLRSTSADTPRELVENLVGYGKEPASDDERQRLQAALDVQRQYMKDDAERSAPKLTIDPRTGITWAQQRQSRAFWYGRNAGNDSLLAPLVIQRHLWTYTLFRYQWNGRDGYEHWPAGWYATLEQAKAAAGRLLAEPQS